MEPTDTKIRLLDTAEHLFAEKGVEATSLRTITAEAGANLAAIHYHFGSKEVLVREVFARRIEPVNKERLRLLDDLESKAGKKALKLQEIIEAFVLPILLMHTATGCDCRPFMRLMGRVYSESENVQKLVFGQFNEVAKRFIDALQRALPKLPEIDVSWRFKFMVGAMAMTVVSHAGFEKQLGEKNELVDMESIINRLMPFLVGGFQAAAPDLGSGKSGE